MDDRLRRLRAGGGGGDFGAEIVGDVLLLAECDALVVTMTSQVPAPVHLLVSSISDR